MVRPWVRASAGSVTGSGLKVGATGAGVGVAAAPEIRATNACAHSRFSGVSLTYQHELNRKTSEAINDQDGIDKANSAIAIIETAITVAQGELDAQ
jgi:hypothetical protein